MYRPIGNELIELFAGARGKISPFIHLLEGIRHRITDYTPGVSLERAGGLIGRKLSEISRGRRRGRTAFAELIVKGARLCQQMVHRVALLGGVRCVIVVVRHMIQKKLVGGAHDAVLEFFQVQCRIAKFRRRTGWGAGVSGRRGRGRRTIAKVSRPVVGVVGFQTFPGITGSFGG